MIVAVVGLAAPFVKMGTLGLGSATYRHAHHALVNTPEQSPADLVDRLSAGKFASGVDLPICVWLESVNEADKEPPDPASAVANVLVAAGVEDQCSPNLTAGLLECKFVQLLVEVRDRLVAVSARERVTIDGLREWVFMSS